ncbi:MAG: hypothetical protein WB783_03365 [Arenicellales bacterium]
MSTGSEIGVLAPGVVRESPLPAHWKKRGRFLDLVDLDGDALLARAFGIEGTLPAPAPLHYLGATGREPRGYCLFAYPVYLHARREQLILMAGREFEPTEAESRVLVARLQEHFPDWRVERTADGMWFVMVDADPQLETSALRDVLGENINDHLPSGPDAMEWHRILNEVQMLLFDSEVNCEREAAGSPALNSLWFWGGGRLPDVTISRWNRVVSNDPVALGIGRRAGIDTRQMTEPSFDVQVPDGESPPQRALWVWSPGVEKASPPVFAAHHWGSLEAMLRRGTVNQLTLIEPGYGELRIDSGGTRPWWRPW